MSLIVVGCESDANPVTKLTHLHGLTEAEVITQLGKPEYTEEFLVGETGDELRIELLNFYPSTNPENRDVMIRELRWKDGTHLIAVWFHKPHGEWEALDSARWPEDVVF